MPVNSFEYYPLTWRPDRNNLTRPVYLSLAQLLENDILNGVLRRDTKLPPQRELADFLDINFTTVTRAYTICRYKGLIYGVKGSGTFVSRVKRKSVAVGPAAPGSRIELGFMKSFEECNEILIPSVRRVRGKKYLGDLLQYDYPLGMPHQLVAAEQFFDYKGDSCAITSGVQNSLAVCFTALFSPGDKIAVDEYTYPNVIELAKAYNLKLFGVSADIDGMLPEKLQNLCRTENIKGIYLMPGCANPTTFSMSGERREQIANIIKKYNLRLIEDDILGFLAEKREKSLSSLAPENSVCVAGTSKMICSGIRVAYIMYPDRFKKTIENAIFNINVKTSSLDAEIVTQFIKDGYLPKMTREKRKKAVEVNRIFEEYFPNNKQYSKIPTLFRCIDINTSRPGDEIEEELGDRSVSVYHSDRFSVSNGEKRFIRVALASVRSYDELREGLNILKNYLIEKGYIN